MTTAHRVDALPPETVRPMTRTLQRLIGCALKGAITLGWLDGHGPGKMLGLDP